ncbi:MAG: efflux RND transporter periplasmic adaptor subunit [Gammaproteobacteria bacterium]|nr:efflux RND transporter periplasmic adaptor subunit [Gammaproteobacteria bacterium]
MAKISRRRLVAAAILAAILVVAYLLWTPLRDLLFGPPSGPGTITVSGNIEAHQSVLSFTQIQAPIVYLPFDEGQYVKSGTVLARVDNRYYLQQYRIDRSNRNVAQAQVAVAQKNLAAAINTVASDRFDLAEKERDLRRDVAQLKYGAISRQIYDQALTARDQSRAALARDQALVGVARANIRLARANLLSAVAKVHLDRVTLSYTSLRAPFSGVLAVREAELGELAAPGVAIFTLDDLGHVWLRAYVNETDLGKVRLGESVTVTTDTYPGKVYHGRIAFISSEAEFTPKTVQTHAERVSLVYRIRIDIANPTHELLPGMPADSTIALLPAGK